MSQQTITLAANSSQAELISGRFFTVISATAKFKVDLGGDRREVRPGSRINGQAFSRLSFYETEGVQNVIVYDAGNEEFQGEIQVSGVSGETFDYPYLMTVGGGTTTVTGSGGAFMSLPLVLTLAGVQYTRKSFHLANRDTGASHPIGIFTTDGKLLDICLVGSDRTFYFTQDVKIRSLDAGTTEMALYYTLYNTTPE